ncbi:hypothetical protein [Flavobacterium aestivum]|uniref:hypothetical protein n=1 Tax=Flavobacterium aestivum TaxID=3003257 RepID=UPI0022858171|nr:hypothetical protein [Flavobacterium aestivum]
MANNIQRIGIGNNKFPDVDESIIDPVPGYFTFDSTTISFDSMVDTFDFDIIPITPIVIRDYSVKDYSITDYK